MNKLLIFLIGAYLIVCPFYIFESGLPQPAHFILVIAFAVMIFSKNIKVIFRDKSALYLLSFVLITIVINSVYYLKFTKSEDGISFLFPVAYYIFNFLFFILFLTVLKQEQSPKNIDKIILFCLISLGIQITLAMLGFNKVTKFIVSGRGVIYFNNPNQLGYFTLLLLTLFTVLPSRYRDNKIIVFAAISAALGLAVFASSRLVIIGVIGLSSFLLYQLRIKLKLKYWLIISLAGLIMASLIYQTEFIQKRIDFIEFKTQRQESAGISEVQARGYDRIWLYPEYLIYGAGEGKNNRFSDQKGFDELHSGFGVVLFAYGVMGFSLFMLFFYKIIEKRMLYNLLILSPIALYNLTHQGFRTPLFWAVLASVYVISLQTEKTTKELT